MFEIILTDSGLKKDFRFKTTPNLKMQQLLPSLALDHQMNALSIEFSLPGLEVQFLRRILNAVAHPGSLLLISSLVFYFLCVVRLPRRPLLLVVHPM